MSKYSKFRLTAGVLLTCGVGMAALTEAHAFYFFENSRRRPSAFQEIKPIAKVNSCVGFFVKNSQRRNLLVTARHCLDYSASKFCGQDGKVFDALATKYRQCRQVIIESSQSDIVMLEIDGSFRGNENALSLAGFSPKKSTRLKVVGHPVDPYAFDGYNSTENCWSLSSKQVYPYKNRPLWNKGLQDPAYYYNCSIYSGNSGGPVIFEGSDIVVGMPYIFAKNQFGNHRSNFKRSAYALMSHFVKAHQVRLAQLGIQIAGRPNQNGFRAQYLRSGHYTSDRLPGCTLALNVKHITGPDPVELDVTSKGSTCEESTYFECEEKRCVSPQGSIIQIKGGAFEYVSRSGFAFNFKWTSAP